MSDLTDLKRRVEEATGPDRDLDCLLQAALVHKVPAVRSSAWNPPRFFANPTPDVDWIGYDLAETSPRYTASLDATVALIERVLPGAEIEMWSDRKRGRWNAQLIPAGKAREDSFGASHVRLGNALLAALLSACEGGVK